MCVGSPESSIVSGGEEPEWGCVVSDTVAVLGSEVQYVLAGNSISNFLPCQGEKTPPFCSVPAVQQRLAFTDN